MDEPTTQIRELLQAGYRYALALTHHHYEAEDLVQEAWMRVFNAFLRSRPELKRSELVWLAGFLEYHDAWEAQTLRKLADSSRKPERWVVEVAEALRPSPQTGTMAQTNL